MILRSMPDSSQPQVILQDCSSNYTMFWYLFDGSLYVAKARKVSSSPDCVAMGWFPLQLSSMVTCPAPLPFSS